MHGSLDAVDYADQHNLWANNQIAKYRVQVPIILIATAAIQYLTIAIQTGGSPTQTLFAVSVSLTLAANCLSLILYRRLRHYPGTRRIAFIFPSFITIWAGALGFLLLSRLDYSSLQLAIGFSCGLGLTFVFNTLVRQTIPCSWLVIPSRRVSEMLVDLPDLDWKVASTPEQVTKAKNPVIVDLRADIEPNWEEAIAKVAVDGVPVYHIKQLRESLTGRVQIEHLSENASGLLAPDPTYAFFKGMAERAIAAMLLCVSSPLLILAAVAIRLETPGPALFRQTRIGFRGEKFTIFKLRTMTATLNDQGRVSDITQENDPRVTRLGFLLRKTRIDELPQLVNVIFGEMSIIGPRPETENLSAWYREAIDFYPYRHAVLPGITGWAQVKQGHVATPDQVLRKLEYDLFYIKHFSLWLDLVIALKTIRVMLFNLGAK